MYVRVGGRRGPLASIVMLTALLLAAVLGAGCEQDFQPSSPWAPATLTCDPPVPGQGEVIVRVGRAGHLYSQASTSSTDLGVIPAGARVMVIGNPAGGWANVYCTLAKQGWAQI
jgi:hypothetical protein